MKITRDAIRYENQLFPMKNIASAKLMSADVTRPQRAKVVWRRRLVLLVGALLAAGYASAAAPWDTQAKVIGWGIAGALILAMLYRGTRTVTHYALQLQTNAGAHELFWSDDRAFMERVRDIVFDALSTSNPNFAYNVNIENQQINNQSSSVTVNHVINNYDYSIHTTNMQLPEDAKIYIRETVNPALTDVAREVEATGNEALIAALREVVEALKAPKPERSRILKLWDGFRSACEAYGSISTAATAAAAVYGLASKLI